ncbi:hypothetical protein H2198_000463 [Neophaeococcomyces mojaviensis]|uniref:Uncharacterized protein n=1 Tax=Neophaeococcomyces mojaviensis TaxID=3383035 RepID=A0ACC3AKR2_9EURO|nr:hypothetical protein H2198_000463 [Knufia sp. JES_112]
MKFTATFLALMAAIPLTVYAIPSPEPGAAAGELSDLMKRAACTVPIDLAPDASGTCVDTTRSNSCPNGILVTGHCPGANNIICCIPRRCGIGTP